MFASFKSTRLHTPIKCFVEGNNDVACPWKWKKIFLYIFFSVRQWMFQNWCKWNQNCNLLVRNRLLSNTNMSKVNQYFRCLDGLRLCCHTSTLYADGNYSYTSIIVRKNLSERSDCLMISYCMMYNSVDAKTLKPILVNISVWICFEYTCMATKNDMVWTVCKILSHSKCYSRRKR